MTKEWNPTFLNIEQNTTNFPLPSAIIPPHENVPNRIGPARLVSSQLGKIEIAERNALVLSRLKEVESQLSSVTPLALAQARAIHSTLLGIEAEIENRSIGLSGRAVSYDEFHAQVDNKFDVFIRNTQATSLTDSDKADLKFIMKVLEIVVPGMTLLAILKADLLSGVQAARQILTSRIWSVAEKWRLLQQVVLDLLRTIFSRQTLEKVTVALGESAAGPFTERLARYLGLFGVLLAVYQIIAALFSEWDELVEVKGWAKDPAKNPTHIGLSLPVPGSMGPRRLRKCSMRDFTIETPWLPWVDGVAKSALLRFLTRWGTHLGTKLCNEAPCEIHGGNCTFANVAVTDLYYGGVNPNGVDSPENLIPDELRDMPFSQFCKYTVRFSLECECRAESGRSTTPRITPRYPQPAIPDAPAMAALSSSAQGSLTGVNLVPTISVLETFPFMTS